MTRPLTMGTAWFPTRAAAVTYYARQGDDTVDAKISEGLIHIGEPPAFMQGHAVVNKYLGDEGTRWFVTLDTKKYKVVRMYMNGRKRTLHTGLTLEAAQRHCKDPESSSRTCTKSKGRRRTAQHGPWFDGYTAE